MKAWLVTWEWVGEHVAKKNKIVSILNPKLSADTVRNYIEQLYVDIEFSLEERMAYAKSKINNPNPAEFAEFPRPPKGPGGRYKEIITCGHNPHLFARKVLDIKITTDDNGDETPTWIEPPAIEEISRNTMKLHNPK